MKVQRVIIEEKDLKQIMKDHGISSYKQWAKMAGFNYPYLINCVNGKRIMGEQAWKKLSSVL